jgi:hypothetical protein
VPGFAQGGLLGAFDGRLEAVRPRSICRLTGMRDTRRFGSESQPGGSPRREPEASRPCYAVPEAPEPSVTLEVNLRVSSSDTPEEERGASSCVDRSIVVTPCRDVTCFVIDFRLL